MQQVNILQLRGAASDEAEWTIANVYASYEEAVEALAAINAEYDTDFTVYTLNDNARITAYDVVDDNWGY